MSAYPPKRRSDSQRKRVQLFFDYAHRFEAYVPKEKRLYGDFALPVLVGAAGQLLNPVVGHICTGRSKRV